MNTAETFNEFLSDLTIQNPDVISLRYGEVTASLNGQFRDTDSKTANSLQVGSYGRWTGINNISDLDMLYIMPKSAWSYQKGGQGKLLSLTKDAIQARYPKTEVKVDRLVVQVMYVGFQIEVQPVFEQTDGSFKYPDTYNGGSWKTTKPREEIEAMKEFTEQKNNNLRHLCRMTRAWKNKHGVGMGGLLIDTTAYNIFEVDDRLRWQGLCFMRHDVSRLFSLSIPGADEGLLCGTWKWPTSSRQVEVPEEGEARL